MTLVRDLLARPAAPVFVERWDETAVHTARLAYSDLSAEASHVVVPFDAASVCIEDRWEQMGETLRVHRQLSVKGSARGGFLTGVLLPVEGASRYADVDVFAPGMLYGRAARISDGAIGSRAGYCDGVREWRIREDRLPAPLVGVWRPSGSVCVLNPHPNAATTPDDAADVEAESVLIDERIRLLSIGLVEARDGGLSIGGWYPGTEGEVTYRGDTYPGGQLRRWRRRYLPLRDGLTASFTLTFRFSQAPTFTDFTRDTWRWAWATLAPRVQRHDLDVVRVSCLRSLVENARTLGGRTGFNIWMPANTAKDGDSRQYMGFVGRCTDAAYHLLREAGNPRSSVNTDERARWREIAVSVLDDFATLNMDPPQAEGFDHGVPHTFPFLGKPDVLYLRSLCEGARAALRAWQLECARPGGANHPNWRGWTERFVNWLLRQQNADGSFPRGFRSGTGEVVDESPRSSFAAIECLVLVAELLEQPACLDAARAAGEYAWTHGHNVGAYVGGTIDNPDVIDKEAGTLAAAGYLALLEATDDLIWLDRARAAADFAETWIYLWDVPMPAGVSESELHWKPGCSTVGCQLISTGHSLVDQYMTFDVGMYAKLYRHTGDPHYRDVAEILLHNTKSMLALPGRSWDLVGPGWQQEHWSLAPRRGVGLHRGWLPWIPVSHLEGITALEDFDPRLFRALAAGGA